MLVSVISCMGPLKYTLGACRPLKTILIPLFTPRGLKDASSFTPDELIHLSTKSINSHVATLQSHPACQKAAHAYAS